MGDKAFWIAFKQGLLAIVAAIDRRWCLGKHKKSKGESDGS